MMDRFCVWFLGCLILCEGLLAQSASLSLPEGLRWETNLTDPIYSSMQAKPGGHLHLHIPTFPLTLQTVGPNSRTPFASFMLDGSWTLVTFHPNTRRTIPLLASHWAFSNDRQALFFKIHSKARWSDGVPVTADDFLFALDMMRSPHILDPHTNNFAKKHIQKILKYDEKTIGIFATSPRPNLEQYLNLRPRPKHFYKGKVTKDFVEKYNWAIEPVTGPYLLTEIRKGKGFTFEKQKNWWAQNLRYIKNRFNPQKLIVKVVRDERVVFEQFKKGLLDTFDASVDPERWHLKCRGNEFEKGYMEKTTFYTQTPRFYRGFYLNTSHVLFTIPQIKQAFAHAMNIELSLKQVFRGDMVRMERAFTGYGPYENKTIQARKYNVKQVETLMKSLGWKRGQDGIWTKGTQRFSVRVTYIFDYYTDHLSFLKQEAQKAGVELILEFLDGAMAFQKVQDKRHEATFVAWPALLTPSPWEFFHSDNARPGTNNFSNTSDQALDRLIDQYQATREKSEHIRLAKAIAQRIHDLGDFIPSHYSPYVRACHWRWIKAPKGAAATLLATLMAPQKLFNPTHYASGGLLWIDEAVKQETLKAQREGRVFSPVNRVQGNKP